MTLEPEMHAFIARTESFYAANAVELSVAEQREMYRRLCQEFTPDRPMGVLTRDAMIEGLCGPIPVRHYYTDASKGAERAGQGEGPPACVLYLHGGGFVVGDLDSHDFICAHFAAETGANVIAIDYRLAPEHTFPAAFEDALAAYRAVRDQPERWGIDAERIVVAGDSAGANLTAAVVLASRDDTGPRAVGQILFYGRFGWGFDLPSFQTEADAPLLTTSDVRYYRKVYCGPDAEPDPRHSPLTATGLSRLPPALLLPVEHDPLRDESFAYGEALRADGVDAEVHLGVGLVHGSLRALHTSPGVRKMVDLAVSAIKTWAR